MSVTRIRGLALLLAGSATLSACASVPDLGARPEIRSAEQVAAAESLRSPAAEWPAMGWWTSGSDFWTLALPQLIQGAGMPFFFVPLTTIALGAVEEEETASAAGVMNFLRTMAGAVAVAISTTLWYDSAQEKRAALSGVLNGAQGAMDRLTARGYSFEQARMIVSQVVDKESVALATGQTFVIAAFVFATAAWIIWLAPRPTRAVDASAVH